MNIRLTKGNAIKGVILFFGVPFLIFICLSLFPCKTCLDGVSFSKAVFDRNGNLMRIFLSDDEKYRIKKPLSDFSPDFIQMILIKEDRYFYSHIGFNPSALIKAAWNSYIVRNYRMGASTVSMQLVRIKYGINTSTIPGKIKQINMAVAIELRHSKQEILEAYMNLVPCGYNIEGFPAAAYYYFHKDLNELSLSEMLFLAVLPQDPNGRAPSRTEVPAESLAARELLFNDWLHFHPEDSESRVNIDMPIRFFCSFPFKIPHAAEYLKNRTSLDVIKTTLDDHYQRLVENQAALYLRTKNSLGVNNCSIMLLDFTTMEVLAAMGSADFFDDKIEGQVNGFAAKRSPGSLLKPFIYAKAIEQGLIHPNSVLSDAPTSFGVYTPDNYQSDFKGPVKAWEALVHSRNIPAIRLASQIKNPDLYDILKKAGIDGLKSRKHYGLSIVLGSAEVTMIELMSLYASLANEGVQHPVRFILEDGGTPVSLKKDEDSRLFSVESSILTLRMLDKNPSPIESRPMNVLDVPIAYKTGTSIGFKDCWSAAVFDRFVLCVWIGNFNGEGNPAFLGRETAAPLLFNIADSIISEIPSDERYKAPMPPDTIKQVDVCSVSGCIPNSYCTHTIKTDFIPGVSPITKCKIHRQIFVDTKTGLRTERKGDSGVVSQVREFWSSDMLEQFKKAGLPRLVPPPFEIDEDSLKLKNSGSPPRITNPLAGGAYIIRHVNTRNNVIPLLAVSDADTSYLYWFANDLFIGKSPKGDSLEWYPSSGHYTVTVVDDAGRSNSCEIDVEEAE
ncbi:MAG: penicillin-binding protein 1C [Spirochaetales bacterium]|nr:penicillin-binding protein 1C [Spirochaetales bacterium]